MADVIDFFVSMAIVFSATAVATYGIYRLLAMKLDDGDTSATKVAKK